MMSEKDWDKFVRKEKIKSFIYVSGLAIIVILVVVILVLTGVLPDVF